MVIFKLNSVFINANDYEEIVAACKEACKKYLKYPFHLKAKN